MIRFGPEILRDWPQAVQREWLETDGLGGFAMGTIIGANTRRYHGLLIAATRPPVGRRLLVAKIEERLLADGLVCELSCNEYEGAIHPQGHLCQEEFRLDPWPVFEWAQQGYRLRKAVFMPHEQGLTVLCYQLLEAPRAAWLHLRPLVAGRDMHHLQRASGAFRSAMEWTDHRFTIIPYDEASRLTIDFPGGEFRPDGLWFYNFRYFREAERGLDYLEDLYSPGEMVWLLRPGECAWLVLSRFGAPADFQGEACMAQERQRREALQAPYKTDVVARQLAIAADQFVVKREEPGKSSYSIIAGYPWFGDWGRDTLISLFGLTLTPKHYEKCRAVLETFLRHMRRGLVPNYFSEEGEPAYNTADATLWLFVAVRQYLEATQDWGFGQKMWPRLIEALEAHIAGTDYDIRMEEDGLLWAGNPQLQLTWMDAKVGEWIVTPRHGKAVEINGLWFNALKIGAYVAEKIGDPSARRRYEEFARRAKASFGQFWNAELGYCYDVLRPEGPDASLRPNQLIACALPYQVLSRAQRQSLLEKVTAHLLTPYGLRTLAPGSPGYCAHYRGDPWARDGAYHQGTVWPWLMGSYVATYFGVWGVNEQTRRHVRTLLEPLVEHLFGDAGLGSISEIFDAEEPFAPNGCIAQAWSVAEIFRVWRQYRLGEL